VADEVAAAARLPLLHIADTTSAALRAAGVRRAAFLGTRFSMEDRAIVIARLEPAGTAVIVPAEADRALMHRVIFEERCRGVIREDTRAQIVALINRQTAQGADAVVLGCTEIGLLIDSRCSPLPCFDTTALHAAAAVEWMPADASPA
jgi:aspartate racemase